MLVWFVALVVVIFGFVVFFGAPYVPTMRRDTRRIFKELYPLSKNDVLVDLGSGDGVLLREAAHFGAMAVGYELNPLLVWGSRWLSRASKGITIHTGNMWSVTLPEDTTVVYVFVVTRDAKKLVGKLQSEVDRLKKPLKVISHGIQLPDKVPIKSVGAHFLYDFLPLHVPKT